MRAAVVLAPSAIAVQLLIGETAVTAPTMWLLIASIAYAIHVR
jgi:hypothetical protein